MKKTLLIPILLLFIILASCSSKEVIDPNDTLTKFTKTWSSEKYDQLYDYFTTETIKAYKKDDFSDHLEHVYQTIGAHDFSVKYDEIETDEIEAANENKSISLPLKFQFKTAADTIKFTQKIKMELIEVDDETEVWMIDWNEALILPDFTADSDVYVEQQAPKRGEIVDRNQMPLALNDTAYEVGLVPEKLENEASEIEQVANLLSTSVDKINNQLNASWVQPDYFVPIQTIPSSAQDLYQNLQAIPGVSIQETSGRVYPLGPAAAHLTGYIGPISAEELAEEKQGVYTENDIIGKTGLEKLYEEQLRGESGIKIWMTTDKETGGTDESLLSEQPVKNGEKIELNIDANYQEKIYKSFGDDAGSAVAINPKTGETLALVNHPAFDPNNFAYGISQDNWDQLMNHPKSPLLNRFSSTYAPGSVIKPITAGIGLESGKLDPEEALEINGKTWKKDNWNKSDFITRYSIIDNPVDLEKAMVHSDNIYFAREAIKIGSDDFIKGLKAFGFEEKIPFEINIEPSQISNDGQLDEFLLANTSYGQGQMEMSPFHITYAYTAFLNEGNIIKPSLLASDKKSEVWKKDVISKADASLLKKYMREVVENGSAKVANTKKLPLSGKTGTAELKSSRDESGQSNGWFIAYTTEDEDVLMSMMVEDVEGRGISAYVAEKAKDAFLDIKKIKK